MASLTIEDAILDKWRETMSLAVRVRDNQTFIDDAPLLNEDEDEELDFPIVEVAEKGITSIRRANDGTEVHIKQVEIAIRDVTREKSVRASWAAYSAFNRLGGPGQWDWEHGAILDMKPVSGMVVDESDGIASSRWIWKVIYTYTG